MAEFVANQTWWFIVLIAGIGYGIVGFLHDRFRFFVSLGAIGKLVFFFLISYLWLISSATDFAIIVATGDLCWAIFFIYFIYQTKEYGFI